MIYEAVERLSKLSPNAVFTKAEATKMTEKIILEMLQEEDEGFSSHLAEVAVASEDFDQEDHYDQYLDDVQYLTWEDIDSLVNSKLSQLEGSETT